jgi:hypothetical protein
MGCLFAILALITPRFVVFVMWIFTDYLATAYGSWFWPTLGFFIAPTTTLAYASRGTIFRPRPERSRPRGRS